MSEHTPGPWQLNESGFSVYGPGEDGWGIAALYLYEHGYEGITDEVQKVNARLIAAAPVMLAALEAQEELNATANKLRAEALAIIAGVTLTAEEAP